MNHWKDEAMYFVRLVSEKIENEIHQLLLRQRPAHMGVVVVVVQKLQTLVHTYILYKIYQNSLLQPPPPFSNYVRVTFVQKM